MRTNLLGRRRARSRFTSLWEFALFVVVLLVGFLAVVDMAVVRGDDHLLHQAASETAAVLADADPDADPDDASGASAGDGEAQRRDGLGRDSCEPAGLRTTGPDDRDSLPADALCLVKSGVAATQGDARVRIERGADAVTVCVMAAARSVTGLLAPVQSSRTLRAVATHATDDDGRGDVWMTTERPLAGSDWAFCPAGRGLDVAS